MSGSEHNHTVEPFREDHLDGVPWIEERYARIFGRERALREYARHPGFSGFCNGRFVGAAGIVSPYPGLGEAWAIAGPLVATHRAFFHRSIARMLRPLAQAMRVRRLQALVRQEFATSHRWMRALGFKPEAVLRRYGLDGGDMTVYVMFPDSDEEVPG